MASSQEMPSDDRVRFVPGGRFLPGDEELDITPPKELSAWTIQFERRHRQVSSDKSQLRRAQGIYKTDASVWQKLIRKFNSMMHSVDEKSSCEQQEMTHSLDKSSESSVVHSSTSVFTVDDPAPSLDALQAEKEREDIDFWATAAEFSTHSDLDTVRAARQAAGDINYDAAFKALIIASLSCCFLWLSRKVKMLASTTIAAGAAYTNRSFHGLVKFLDANDELQLIPLFIVVAPFALLVWVGFCSFRALRWVFRGGLEETALFIEFLKTRQETQWMDRNQQLRE
jgi:hypothetical protein